MSGSASFWGAATTPVTRSATGSRGAAQKGPSTATRTGADAVTSTSGTTPNTATATAATGAGWGRAGTTPRAIGGATRWPTGRPTPRRGRVGTTGTRATGTTTATATMTGTVAIVATTATGADRGGAASGGFRGSPRSFRLPAPLPHLLESQGEVASLLETGGRLQGPAPGGHPARGAEGAPRAERPETPGLRRQPVHPLAPGPPRQPRLPPRRSQAALALPEAQRPLVQAAVLHALADAALFPGGGQRGPVLPRGPAAHHQARAIDDHRRPALGSGDPAGHGWGRSDAPDLARPLFLRLPGGLHPEPAWPALQHRSHPPAQVVHRDEAEPALGLPLRVL